MDKSRSMIEYYRGPAMIETPSSGVFEERDKDSIPLLLRSPARSLPFFNSRDYLSHLLGRVEDSLKKKF